MHQSTISLLVYLENQYVLHDGFINQGNLSKGDLKSIEYWKGKNQIDIQKLPLPDAGSAPEHTHKIRLSKRLFEAATEARKQFAQRTRPLKNSKEDRKSGLKLVQNGQVKDAPAPKAPDLDTADPKKYEMIDFEQYQAWLQNNGQSLSPPQHKLAQLIFAVLKDPALKEIATEKGTGQSWVFKSIDQYLTTIKNR